MPFWGERSCFCTSCRRSCYAIGCDAWRHACSTKLFVRHAWQPTTRRTYRRYPIMLYVGHDVMHTFSSQEQCIIIGLVDVIDASSGIRSVAHDVFALTPAWEGRQCLNAQRRPLIHAWHLIRDHLLSTNALIPGFQTHSPALCAKIMTSLRQQYIILSIWHTLSPFGALFQMDDRTSSLACANTLLKTSLLSLNCSLGKKRQ